MPSLKLVVQWQKNKSAVVKISDVSPHGDGCLYFEDTANLSKADARRRIVDEAIVAIPHQNSELESLRKQLTDSLMTELEARGHQLATQPPEQVIVNQPGQQPLGYDSEGAALTDAGNAYCFVRQWGYQVRFCPAWEKWLLWDGKRWAIDDMGIVMRMAKDTAYKMFQYAVGLANTNPDKSKRMVNHAIKSMSAHSLNAMLRLAQVEVPVMPDQLDGNPMLLCVQNGTINLCTGQLKQHDPEDLITKISPVSYDPAADSPAFNAFLDRIMEGDQEMISYLMRLLGWCMTGDIRHHVMPIFWGDGANGKSTLIDLVMFILGDHATIAPNSLLTSGSDEHPTEFADLHGRRLVVASETDESKRLRVEQVKRLTGDEFIKGRFMRQDFFQFKRTHKTILVTNNRPRITEDSIAIWRRIKLVEFSVVIPRTEQDPSLPAKLKAEAPGVLARLVRGCMEWFQAGYMLREPSKVEMATEDYRSDEDPLAGFLADRCVLQAGASVSRKDIWRDYELWAKDSSIKYPLGNRNLFDRLRRISGVEDVAIKVNGKAVRCFRGIGRVVAGVVADGPGAVRPPF